MAKSSKSPTQRSLAMCRSLGHTAAVVERWNQFAKVRQDLFGFADLLVLTPGQCVAVQATSGTNVSARLDKIRDEPRVRDWLRAGCGLEVHGWRLAGAKGKRKTYQVRIIRVWLDGEALVSSEDDS